MESAHVAGEANKTHTSPYSNTRTLQATMGANRRLKWETYLLQEFGRSLIQKRLQAGPLLAAGAGGSPNREPNAAAALQHQCYAGVGESKEAAG